MPNRHGTASLAPMTQLDVTDLVRIAAVARHGGFTRAAGALGMTQPALTRSIAAAERVVGGALFVRRRPRAEPTALCRMILDEAPGIIERVQNLHRRISQVRGGSGEELSLASGPFTLDTVVLPAVAAFQRRHPRVRLRIETSSWPDALGQVRGGRCDLAVLTAGADFSGTDLTVLPLPAQRLVFAVRCGHPLTRMARPTPARILAYPLASTAQLVPRIHAALAGARGEDAARPRADFPFPAVMVESNSAWLSLACQSDFVALTTITSAMRYVAAGQIAILPIERPWLVTRHAVVHASTQPLSGLAADFVAEVEAANARSPAVLGRVPAAAPRLA